MDEVTKPPNALDRLDAILGKGVEAAGKAWDAVASVGLGPAFQHGSSELMAAIYTGNGFVQYGAGMQPEKEPEQQSNAADRGQSLYGPEQEQDRGGREM